VSCLSNVLAFSCKRQCVFRQHSGTDSDGNLGSHSGRTWAPVPEHLGTDSAALGQ